MSSQQQKQRSSLSWASHCSRADFSPRSQSQLISFFPVLSLRLAQRIEALQAFLAPASILSTHYWTRSPFRCRVCGAAVHDFSGVLVGSMLATFTQ